LARVLTYFQLFVLIFANSSRFYDNFYVLIDFLKRMQFFREKRYKIDVFQNVRVFNAFAHVLVK